MPRRLQLPVLGTPPEGLTREQWRARRRRNVRASTICVKRLTKRDLEAGRKANPPVNVERPKTRGDCERMVRPCPFVACRWNLYLDVSPRNGSIHLNFPDVEPGDMVFSCCLDVCDVGGATLEQTGVMMNLTRERVRQLELSAVEKIEQSGAFSEQRREARP